MIKARRASSFMAFGTFPSFLHLLLSPFHILLPSHTPLLLLSTHILSSPLLSFLPSPPLTYSSPPFPSLLLSYFSLSFPSPPLTYSLPISFPSPHLPSPTPFLSSLSFPYLLLSFLPLSSPPFIAPPLASPPLLPTCPQSSTSSVTHGHS